MEKGGQVGMSLRFDRELHDRLRQVAFERRVKQSEVVREALRQYLDKLEQEKREGEQGRQVAGAGVRRL